MAKSRDCRQRAVRPCAGDQAFKSGECLCLDQHTFRQNPAVLRMHSGSLPPVEGIWRENLGESSFYSYYQNLSSALGIHRHIRDVHKWA